MAFVVGLSILVVSPAWARAEAPGAAIQHLEHLMIENADTPEEHGALARYYQMKAADARSLAEEHRAMARRYMGGKITERQAMMRHCERIAELNDELATQYEGLAKGEDTAAGE